MPHKWFVFALFVILIDLNCLVHSQSIEKSPQVDRQQKKGANEKAIDAQLAKAAKARADFSELHPLGLDEKLLVRLTVIEKYPRVSNVLPRLAEATGLKFTLADNLSHHDPVLGHSLPKDTRAYSILEIIAECDLADGHWEKTEDGYRLEGGSLTPPPLLPPRKFGWFWPAFAISVMFIAVGGIVIYRRRGKTAAKTS